MIHLSKEEFDAKLESLKRKQSELNQYFFQERSSVPKCDWNDDETKFTTNISHKDNFSGNDKYVPSSRQAASAQINGDYERLMTPVPWTDGRNGHHKSGSKSVRINSAKSNPFSYRSDIGCGNLKKVHDTDLSNSWLDLPVAPAKCRSKSASPFRSTPSLTVPKPFKMTQR